MYDTQRWVFLPCFTSIEKQVWRQKNRYGNYKNGLREVAVDKIPGMILNRLLVIDPIASVKIAKPNNLN